MASEPTAGLASLIVGFCRSSFNFSSQLKVKGLITITVDQCTITYVDIDETVTRDGRGKLDVGPRNALQQWKQAQNSGQALQQNQWLQQQQLQHRVRSEGRCLPAPPQSPSQRFQMPQMPARVRMPAPQMQSPKVSSARMVFVPKSVVRLKKMPGHVVPSQSIISATPSSVPNFLPVQGRHAMAGQNESQAVGVTDCILPSATEIRDNSDEMNNVADPLGAAQFCNQASLCAVINKNNKNTNRNQHFQIVTSGQESGDNKEPRKKSSKKPSGQETKKAQEAHPEEEQEQEDEEEECKPLRPKVKNGDSKEPWKKISRMPSGPRAKKAQVKHSEEEKEDNKDEEMEKEEEENDKTSRQNVPKEMTSLSTTAQNTAASADEGLTSKVGSRKRPKKVGKVDDAKMPKLEKVDNANFWNTFVTKGAGKKKAVARKAKS